MEEFGANTLWQEHRAKVGCQCSNTGVPGSGCKGALPKGLALNAKMNSTSFNTRSGAGRAWSAPGNLMLNPLSKIYAAIIIVIVAAAVNVAAKNILRPVLGRAGGGFQTNAARFIGALEQVGIGT